MFTLVSTRFNNTTFEENVNYRKKREISCIYCSPQPMSPKIPPESLVATVEMNNSTNQVEGIGLIKNQAESKVYNVYDTRNFNRYIFKGNYRISREELLRNHEKLLEILDQILFKGKTHLKRGSGFTTIPEKLLTHPVCENRNIKQWIQQIFIEKYSIINEK
jgi:hypothetical protein